MSGDTASATRRGRALAANDAQSPKPKRAAAEMRTKNIDSRSKAGCLSRNSAVDDSIGESYGVTDFSVQ